MLERILDWLLAHSLLFPLLLRRVQELDVSRIESNSMIIELEGKIEEQEKEIFWLSARIDELEKRPYHGG